MALLLRHLLPFAPLLAPPALSLHASGWHGDVTDADWDETDADWDEAAGEAAGDGLLRWPKRCRDSLQKEVAVHVSSFGGVGTTSFMHELGRVRPSLSMNDYLDHDCLKHVPYPRLRLRETPERIIYLHGDPLRAVLSLDRRGWFLRQAMKLRVDPLPSKGKYPKTLQDYLGTRHDDFLQLEKHFDSYRTQCEVPVAFLRITEKTDHNKELAAFLNVSVDQVRRRLKPWIKEKAKVQLLAAGSGQEDNDGDVWEEGNAEPGPGEPSLANSSRQDSSSGQGVYDELGLEGDPWVVERLKQKLRRITKKLDALPGFAVQIPGVHCRRDGSRQRRVAPTGAQTGAQTDAQADAQTETGAETDAE